MSNFNVNNLIAKVSLEPWYTEMINGMCTLLKASVANGMPEKLALDLLTSMARELISEAVKVETSMKEAITIKIDGKKLSEQIKNNLNRI